LNDESRSVLGITQSITGQAWRWRETAVDARDPDFAPDDLVAQLLMARGVPRDDLERHRDPTIRAFMPDPSIFQDMDVAARRLADAVEAGEQITVYGDYDVDGATSAALLIRLLAMLGLEAGYYIPDRLMEGYGPSGEALVRIGEGGSKLIVTVDCGAMAYDALAEAKAAGLEVIVVDHHKCAAELPETFALVNPNRLDEVDEAAAHRHLAAVGVAFLLGAAIIRDLRFAWARVFQEARRTENHGVARSGRARHSGRCRQAAGAQPGVCGAGAEDYGGAAQYRLGGAGRG